MLTVNSDIKNYDELIIERDNLCTQIESGNPFFANQNVVFSKKATSQFDQGQFCEVRADVVTGKAIQEFYEKKLELSLDRSRRLPQAPSVANAVALSYLRVGETDKAIKVFQNALAMDKNYFPAIANLDRCYSIKGDFERALRIYEKLEKENKNDVRFLINIALLHLNNKNIDDALAYFKKAQKIEPMNYSVLNNIGMIYLIKGNLSSAISLFRNALKNKNDDYTIYNNLGVCFVALNNVDKSLYYFKIAYRLNKSGKNVINNLSNVLQKIGDHESVISLVDDFLQAHPEDVGMRNLISWSYFQMELYQKCLRELKRTADYINPESKNEIASVFNNMGIVYKKINKISRAEGFFLKSLQTYTDPDVIVYYNLIHFYFGLKRLDKAKTIIDESLVLFKDNPIILSYLGDYYSNTLDYETAQEIYYKVLNIDAKILTPYLRLSTIYADVYEDTESALELLKKGLIYHPEDLALLNNYAYCYLLQGNLSKARVILDNVKTDNETHLTATRGMLLIKEGNIKEGRSFYNRAITLAGSDVNLANLVKQKKHLELGTYYSERGNKREAIRLLKSGLIHKTDKPYYEKQIIKLLNELKQ